ncbi:DUF4399 domain-containing protein [Gymnodinialimonas sp. 2305UL16-5]
MKLLIAATLIACPSAVLAQDTPAPEGAEVYFVNLEDGATVTSPVTIVFGLSGMGVAPAGTEQEGTGHHHLFLNRAPLGEGEEGAEELLYGIPADDNHIHFGGGQTEVTLDLAPGEYTMQLVMGDLNHVPHVPPIASEYITVNVE